MNMIQKGLQGYWKYSLVGALVIGGAIASWGGYAFAQTQCDVGKPCNPQPGIPHHPHGPNWPARRINVNVIDELQKSHPQAIQQLRREDPQAIQKLRRHDPETIERLEQLAPNSKQQLEQYAPVRQ